MCIICRVKRAKWVMMVYLDSLEILDPKEKRYTTYPVYTYMYMCTLSHTLLAWSYLAFPHCGCERCVEFTYLSVFLQGINGTKGLVGEKGSKGMKGNMVCELKNSHKYFVYRWCTY